MMFAPVDISKKQTSSGRRPEVLTGCQLIKRNHTPTKSEFYAQ